MPGLSNFLSRRNEPSDLEIRPAQRHEIEAALRLILAGNSNASTESSVLDFLAMSVSRGLDLHAIWVIVDESGRVQWAALPLELAGRAMLLMLPPRLRPGVEAAHVSQLLSKMLADPRHHAIRMAQALLDPSHGAVLRAVRENGFHHIAELVYLSRSVRTPLAGRLLPDKIALWKYDESTHARFANCIERTYIDSLDCPDLNGRRDMGDIIAGHKAAGEFDPDLWMLISDVDGTDLATMLLNRLHQHDGYELVYIGLVPEARGRGLADALMRTAFQRLAMEGGGTIVTACDANNAPARKLYNRHGFGYLYSRNALVRELVPTSNLLIEHHEVLDEPHEILDEPDEADLPK